MKTSTNLSWKAGQRPPLRITAAGIRALAYFDCVSARDMVSLAPTDTRVPPDEQPQDPGEQPWDTFPRAHIQTPDETAWAIRQLIDAGATFPNFQDFEDMDDDDDDYGAHSPEED